MGRAGVARSCARTHVSEHLSFVPAGGGLGAARWRERGQCPGHAVGDQPKTAAPSGFMGWGGAGGNSVPQISTIPDPGEGPDHSDSESSAPGPYTRPARPPSCFLHLAGGKSSLLQVHPQRCKQTKTKRCLIEKIKETMASLGIWRPCPCPSFAAPAPALLSRAPLTPIWDSSHRLTQKVSTAFGEGSSPGRARSSQRLCLHRPSGAPAPATPGKTTGGGAAHFSGSVLKGKHFGGLLSGRRSPPPPEISGPVRLLQGLQQLPPRSPEAPLGRKPSPCTLSSFTEQGGQPRAPGRGAGRWRAAGAEGTAGRPRTVLRLGCEAEAEAPHSPASLAQSFLYLRGHTHTEMRLQDWPAAPSPQASHTALRVPKSISAPRNGLWPWGAEDVLRRAPALPGDLAQTPVPQPQPLRAPHSKGSRAAP